MIRQFKSFDAEQSKAMSDAFAAAWKSLKDSDSPATFDGSSSWVRKTIALRIIDAAHAGEHDVGRLRDDALAFLSTSSNQRQANLLAGLSWLEKVRGQESASVNRHRGRGLAVPQKSQRYSAEDAKAEKMAGDAVDHELSGRGLSKETKAKRRGRLMDKPNQMK